MFEIVAKRKSGRTAFMLALICGTAVLVAACGKPAEPIQIGGPAQGTTYKITVMEPGRVDADAVRAAARRVIDDIDRQMSTWRDDSEVSKFNAAKADTWIPVSPALAQVTQRALAIGRDTGGAFDVTLGPILRIWGFGAEADAPQHLPTRAELDAAREKTGIGLIEVRSDPPALRKKSADATLDLAGLAQGFTVDRIAAALEKLGLSHFLVELGGELYAHGSKSDQRPWRIGVEKPESGVRAIERVVGLKNAGMTTSGDYRDYIELDGHRFSHTIDPRTGRPVAHDLRAVTVIAADALTADAMATALLVMGPQVGMRYADKHEIAALFVSGHEGAYTEEGSNAFKPYLKEAK
ncbi:FAD:protein FMN transferase [Salinisphaera aquimarina]|uniref:FAD:protein FMN transferase n=1 Tax=Salinisphaera aquimarina TaxID=2094031 RepID=A0ABV7ESL7_9GAMM